MTDEPEVTSFDVAVEKAWTAFRDTLTRRLEALDDDENVMVELNVPDPDGGAAPYVQVFGGGGLGAEVVSNAYLAPEYRLSTEQEELLEDDAGFSIDRDDAGEPEGNYYMMTSREDAATVVNAVVFALREVFDVIHPSLLRESAPFDLSQVLLPDPADMEPLDLNSTYTVENSWDLMLLVHRTIYALRGEVVDRDEDGDWPLVGLAHVPLYVSVQDDRALVWVWTRVAHEITDHDVALREANILNRDAVGVRFHVSHDALWVRYDLHAAPFVPFHLQMAVALTGQAVVKAAEDFAVRTGGEAVTRLDSQTQRRDGEMRMTRTGAYSHEEWALVRRAAELAWEKHEGGYRKGSSVPYVSHVWSVAAIVMEHGGSPAQAAAALLHDTAEDAGGERVLEEIRQSCGSQVSELVRALSDSLAEDPSQKAPWRERKEAYLAHLADASDDVRLVSAADKLANARSMAKDFAEIGPELWQRFNTKSAEDQFWYYESLVAIFEQNGTSPVLVDELRDTINDLRDAATAPNSAPLAEGGAMNTDGAYTSSLDSSAFRPFHRTVRCAVCGAIATALTLRAKDGGEGWNLVYRGIVAGTSPHGNDITVQEAAKMAHAFEEPLSFDRVVTAELYDNAGFCAECGVPYCRDHWDPSVGGLGRCPEGHPKSLDPHWSPRDYD